MKRITYIVEQQNAMGSFPAPDGTAIELEETGGFERFRIDSPESVFKQNYSLAKSLAYNGKVTVEEVPDPEPAAPSQAEELEELREQLKAQQAVINALLGVEEGEVV